MTNPATPTPLTDDQVARYTPYLYESGLCAYQNGEWVKYEDYASLLADRTALTRRLEEADAKIADYVEREAACCPEDVGFAEYIGALTRRVEELAAANLTPDEREWLHQFARAVAGDFNSLTLRTPPRIARILSTRPFSDPTNGQ